MNQIQYQRFCQLRDHLRTLPPERWDFRHVHRTFTTCQSTGCAIGEMATVWPEDFTLHKEGECTYLDLLDINNHSRSTYEIMQDWFGLSPIQETMFYPLGIMERDFSEGMVPRLGPEATADDVADMMDKYLTLFPPTDENADLQQTQA